MAFMRQAVLTVADNRVVSGFFRKNRLAKGLVERFVAGESLEEGLAAARDLERRGIVTTLDQLGENVSTIAEASAAVASYQTILRQMTEAGLETNISVKLTMLGLDLGRDIAEANMVQVLEVAKEVGAFVRIDMEGSAYTAVTMEVFEKLFAQFPEQVGIVIQTYMHRAEQDVRRAIELGARVRLVKGAYSEPATVAVTSREANDANYVKLMKLLLEGGTYPAIATHDPNLIAAAQEFVREKGIAHDRFEFQMLYGVRTDEQQRLVNAGYRMRVYVPYGTEWYPYFTRRIAERPANALFVLRAIRGK